MEKTMLETVRSSFNRIDTHPGGWDHFTQRFYVTLFAMRDDTREVFAHADNGNDDRLLRGFRDLVNSLADGTSTIDELHLLGRTHHGYGLQPEHYLAVGTALAMTLIEISDYDDWPPHFDQAWRTIYAQMASIMIRA